VAVELEGNMHQYEYDLFISYAHLDNQPTDTGTAEGWIAAFHRDLRLRLSQYLGRRATIWRDDQLTADDDFEAAIVTALKKSAVLVIVMSPTFVDRQWFEKEFSAFIKDAENRGGLLIDHMSRTSTYATMHRLDRLRPLTAPSVQ
jgi:TIR domain-containing protein